MSRDRVRTVEREPSARRLLGSAGLVAASLVWATAARAQGATPTQGAEGRRGAAASPPAPEPFRLAPAVGAPSWLRFGIEHRLRFEHLADDFRVAATEAATAVSMRTLASIELSAGPVFVAGELQDARLYGTASALRNTTLVNPLEPLQAHVGLRAEGLVAPDDEASVIVGRFTMDLGHRRVVARNEFRNTINGFTGIDARWTSATRGALRLFAAWPVTRLPDAAPAMRRNRVELDEEATHTQLGGAWFSTPPLAGGVRVESYAVGLFERDAPGAPTSDRRLVTPGLRAVRAPAVGEVDFELELVGQVGTSRAGAAEDDARDLGHRAAFVHAGVGYRVDAPASPRPSLHVDVASGDADPSDAVNERFDTLFGARRWELGPTGLWGAIARSNLVSVAGRVDVEPARGVDAYVAYRPAWLASARDGWATAPLRDRNGLSGTFVGHQLDGRVRWHALPRNLVFDVGGAALVPGGFARDAPDGTDQTAAYFYSQITGTM